MAQMKETPLNTWEEFEIEANKIFKEYESQKAIRISNCTEPLFRGHADADWKLKTTLERYLEENDREPKMEERDYCESLRCASKIVESLTEKHWNLPELLNDFVFELYKPPPGYEFMVYLRHHGFPSPLLDWTRSPYVAAFFAFCEKEKSNSKEVAIYCYREYIGGVKAGCSDEPMIWGLGPYIATHRRHIIQQCEYTICIKENLRNDKTIYFYSDHEEVFDQNRPDQDKLMKFIIPASERDKALKQLHRMNINRYSLFQSEEALMELLANEVLRKR